MFAPVTKARRLLFIRSWPNGRKTAPGQSHWMRRTLATLALARGAELTTVRDNLRHPSVSTISVYLRTDQAKRARQMRDVFGTPSAWRHATPRAKCSVCQSSRCRIFAKCPNFGGWAYLAKSFHRGQFAVPHWWWTADGGSNPVYNIVGHALVNQVCF